MPIKNEDKDNITEETELFKLVAIAGKAGKYISIDKGPMEVSSPNIRMMRNCFWSNFLEIGVVLICIGLEMV